MDDKVIDLNLERRLSKQGLKHIQDMVAEFTVDNLETLVLIHKPKDSSLSVLAYGADWATVGVAQTVINALGTEMLKQEFDIGTDPNA
jgi:hypothetical protein